MLRSGFSFGLIVGTLEFGNNRDRNSILVPIVGAGLPIAIPRAVLANRARA